MTTVNPFIAEDARRLNELKRAGRRWLKGASKVTLAVGSASDVQRERTEGRVVIADVYGVEFGAEVRWGSLRGEYDRNGEIWRVRWVPAI